MTPNCVYRSFLSCVGNTCSKIRSKYSINKSVASLKIIHLPSMVTPFP